MVVECESFIFYNADKRFRGNVLIHMNISIKFNDFVVQNITLKLVDPNNQE